MLYQRDSSPFWYYKFEVGGVRYRGSTHTANKAKAYEYATKIRREAQEERENPGRRMTLLELADAWLKDGELARRDQQNNYSRVRKLFGNQIIDGRLIKGHRFGLDPELPVHKLTQADLSDLRDARLEEDNSPATINRELALLQSMIRLAAAKGVITPRDLDFAALHGAEGKGKLRWLTLDEENRILARLERRVREEASAATQDQYDLAVLLLDTGARYTEVATLHRGQVDMHREQFDFARQKDGVPFPVGMTTRVKVILERRLARLGWRQYIFPAQQGKDWIEGEDKPRGYAVKGIRAAFEDCGLADPALVERQGVVTVHTFRHTFASRLVQHGASLYDVQCLLGHHSIEQTKVYAKLAPNNTAYRAARLLDAVRESAVPATESATVVWPPVERLDYKPQKKSGSR